MEKKGKIIILCAIVLILLFLVVLVESKKDKNVEGVFAKGDMPLEAIAKSNEVYQSLIANRVTAMVEVKVDEKLELKKTVDGALDATSESLLNELVSLMQSTPNVKVLIQHTVTDEPPLEIPPAESPFCDKVALNVNFAYSNCNLEFKNAGSVMIDSVDVTFSPSGKKYDSAVNNLNLGETKPLPLPPDEKGTSGVTADVHARDANGAEQICSNSFPADSSGYANCY